MAATMRKVTAKTRKARRMVELENCHCGRAAPNRLNDCGLVRERVNSKERSNSLAGAAQVLLQSARVAGQLQIAATANRFALACSSGVNRAFPIGNRPEFELLIFQGGLYREINAPPRKVYLPLNRVTAPGFLAFPKAGGRHSKI